MSRRLTNYKNKIINEVNELYPDVICRYNHRDKGVESFAEYKINKNSKLKNLKKINDFVGDILKIEDIIIRRPVEEDIYIKRNIKRVPGCVYECVIVKSIKENKYYILDINSLNENEINRMSFTKEPNFYIIDISDKSYEIKEDEYIDDDVDLNECNRLLINNEQRALSFKEDKAHYYR